MSNKAFIKLHLSADNSVCIIKTNEIIIAECNTDNDKKYSTLYTNIENINEVTINENIEKIYQIICDSNNSNFALLHSVENNSVILINTNFVSTICKIENEKGSILYFNNDNIESVEVNESPERIYQMIE